MSSLGIRPSIGRHGGQELLDAVPCPIRETITSTREQGIGNDLAALIATAEDKWTRQVVEELGEKELVKATWERAESFAIA